MSKAFILLGFQVVMTADVGDPAHFLCCSVLQTYVTADVGDSAHFLCCSVLQTYVTADFGYHALFPLFFMLPKSLRLFGSPIFCI